MEQRRIGNIRIDRHLATGGMGEVYLGFHERLERPVAVKAIRHEHRMSPASRARFLREARILSKLDHPNICRVYDLIEAEAEDYLVLEYVEGETLSRVLEGEIPEEEKFCIAEGIAEALAAAHGRGVIHRDLKPANVVITPEGTVKVLDFGVARSREEEEIPSETPLAAVDGGEEQATVDLKPRARRDGEGTPLTLPGAMVGTAGYMSPEQASGGKVSEASDLYVLGLLLQRIFTGRSPYPHDLAVPQLLEWTRAGRSLPPEEVDPDLAALLEELKDRDPGRRPPAEAVVRRLREIRDKPIRRQRRVRRVLAGIAGVLALVATAVLTFYLARPAPLLPAEGGKVLLLPFRNVTEQEDLTWVELGLAEMAGRTLDRTPGVEVIPVEEAVRIMAGLGLDRKAPPGSKDLARLARASGARLVIDTEVRPATEGFTFRYTIYGTEGSRASRLLSGGDLVALAAQLSAHLSRRLRPGTLFTPLGEVFSQDPFVNRLYAMGLDRLRTVGPAAAEPYFLVCLDRDPAFVYGRFALASCRYKSGLWEEATTLIEAALEEARRREDPSLEAHGLRLLVTLGVERGRYAEAEEILRERLFPLLDKVESLAARASALNTLGLLTRIRGDLEAAGELFRESLALFEQAGDRLEVAGRRLNLGWLAVARGELAEAEELISEVVRETRELGALELLGGALQGLGALAQRQGRLDEAEARFREALESFRAFGNPKGELVNFINLGVVALERGDLQASEELHREAFGLARRIGDRPSEAHTVAALGYLAMRQGRLAEAQERLEEAARFAAELGHVEVQWLTRRNIAYLRVLQGRLAEAEEILSQAETYRRDKLTLGVRARLAYERGRFDEALALQLQARDARGGWNEGDEALLALYRQAAEEDRRLPLPAGR